MPYPSKAFSEQCMLRCCWYANQECDLIHLFFSTSLSIYITSAGESDDDHEELLAAANAALNASRYFKQSSLLSMSALDCEQRNNSVSCAERACPNSFWKQCEPIFGLFSVEDITYLAQQVMMRL